jgi:hypothetical protein
MKTLIEINKMTWGKVKHFATVRELSQCRSRITFGKSAV